MHRRLLTVLLGREERLLAKGTIDPSSAVRALCPGKEQAERSVFWRREELTETTVLCIKKDLAGFCIALFSSLRYRTWPLQCGTQFFRVLCSLAQKRERKFVLAFAFALSCSRGIRISIQSSVCFFFALKGGIRSLMFRLRFLNRAEEGEEVQAVEEEGSHGVRGRRRVLRWGGRAPRGG